MKKEFDKRTTNNQLAVDETNKGELNQITANDIANDESILNDVNDNLLAQLDKNNSHVRYENYSRRKSGE